MALDPCIKEIIDVSNITETEAREILDRVRKRKQLLNAAGRIDQVEKNLDELVKKDADNIKLAALMQKKHVALSIIKRQSLENSIYDFIEKGGGLKSGSDYQEAVLSILYGSHRRIADSRKSINTRRQAIMAEWIGGMTKEISDTRPHLLKALRKDQALMDDILREMYEIRPEGRSGITKNDDAIFMARLFSKYSETSRIRMNEAGAFVGKLSGWAPQSHDRAKMIKTGREKWTQDIMPALDLERSFPDADPEEIAEILDSVYDTLITGVDNRKIPHITDQPTFTSPRNLAKSLGKHRVLHFKDADAWLNYQTQYGRGNVFTAMTSHLERAARVTSAMETLGPNPDATLKNVLDGVIQNIKNAKGIDDVLKADAIGKLNVDLSKRHGVIGQALAEVLGESSVPHNMTVAKIGSGVRAGISMAKLGMATISSITDLLTSVMNLRYHGLNLFESYSETLKTIFAGKSSKQQKEIAYLLGATYDGIVEDMANRWHAQDSMPGKMADALDKFFRLSGLTWWTERLRAGYGRTISAHMAMRSTDGFSSLSKQYRHVLGLHGIGEKQWNVIRKMRKTAADGREYILPEGVDGLADDVIDDLIADEIARTRGGLKVDTIKNRKAQTRARAEFERRREVLRREARKDFKSTLMGYFADELDYAVLMSDDRTRRLMIRGRRPGTVTGELFRFMAQFKSFPIAYTQRVLGAKRWKIEEKGVDPVGLSNIIAGTLVLGYGAMAAKDFLKGKKPRDPRLLTTWMAAAMQGGGAGIYGDFLFGKYSRFGGGVVETLAGPGISSAARLFETAHGVMTGDRKSGELFYWAMNNTPYVNLWYLRAAMDYGITYHIQEMISPGVLKRRERRLKKEFGQEFIFPPSSMIKYGGGFR